MATNNLTPSDLPLVDVTTDKPTGVGFVKVASGAVYYDNGASFAFVTRDKTNTAAGTTGAQTINKLAGTVNFAAAATSVVVTNSLAKASSIVVATVNTDDATMLTVKAVCADGSITLKANAAATAETRVSWAIVG